MKEGAALAGVSERHLYEMARRGELNGIAVRLGKRWILSRARLLELLGEPPQRS